MGHPPRQHPCRRHPTCALTATLVHSHAEKHPESRIVPGQPRILDTCHAGRRLHGQPGVSAAGVPVRPPMGRSPLQAVCRWWPRDAAEAVRLGITTVVALYLAMLFELQQPEWAGWTVLSVSLATRASSLQKASWRWLGSIVGAVASLVLVDWFAQDTLAFDIALALWLGGSTLFCTVLRGQDSYGFSLMGFTVPIIVLANVSQPLAAFRTAVDRWITLLLGIVCAFASAALVAPGVPAVRGAVAGHMDAAAAACAAWLRAGQRHGDWRDPPVQAVLALDGAVTDAFTEQPSLRSGGAMLRDAAPALLAVLAAGLLRARLPPDDAQWADALLRPAVPGERWRLRRAAAVARMVRHGRRLSARRTRAAALAFDRDWVLGGNNALRTVLAVSLVNAFWFASGWSSGGGAVTWVSLGCILLANRENSAKAASNFLLGAALAELLGTVLHYTVLTSTGDFRLLAAVALPLAMLAAIGRADSRVAVGGGFGLVVFTALEPLNVMEYDLGASLNGIAATMLGLVAAVLSFAALPPPATAETRRRRAHTRIAAAVRAVSLRPAALLPRPDRWMAPTFERAALLVLALRREDDRVGRAAGCAVVAGTVPGALAALAEAPGVPDGQRRRLRALAAVLPDGAPPGFPGLRAA